MQIYSKNNNNDDVIRTHFQAKPSKLKLTSNITPQLVTPKNFCNRLSALLQKHLLSFNECLLHLHEFLSNNEIRLHKLHKILVANDDHLLKLHTI